MIVTKGTRDSFEFMIFGIFILAMILLGVWHGYIR